MPNTPRWFAVACGLLALNVTLVATSFIWRQVSADEPGASTSSEPTQDLERSQQSVDSAGESPDKLPPEKSDETSLEESAADDTNFAAEDLPANPASAANPLDALPIPNDLPRIPPPADPLSLASDPVFQELRKAFAEERRGSANDSAGLAPSTMDAESPALHPSPPSDRDALTALERRLKTAELLCVSARRLAQDAARLAAEGQAESAQQCSQMASQLGQMSARILIGGQQMGEVR